MNNLALVQPYAASRILLVDDDELLRMLISAHLTASGYEVLEADNLAQARQQLRANYDSIDTVVLDRGLGLEDGLSLVHEMKETPAWKNIPVVMLTGYDKPEQVGEGLAAGVFYYLNKPVNQPVLTSVLDLARTEISRHRALETEMQRHRGGFTRMDSAKFNFSSLEHVEQLSCFVANCFPDPSQVLNGIAELMINAIEHGMLGITYEQKSALVARNAWRREVEARAALPENVAKQCEIVFTKRNEGFYVSVTDPGKGFPWRDFLTFDPSRANDAHGRGIASASSCFDQLAYNESGNQAVGFLGQEARLSW